MGVATAVESAINTLLNTFISSKSAALCAVLAPVALTGVTIYIITMGWAVMRGDASDSFHTVLWKVFKIAMIIGIALSAGQFQSTVIDGVQGIDGAFISAFGNANTIGGLIDNMAQPYQDLGDQLWSDATTGVVPKVALLAAAAIVAIAQFFIFIIGLGMYLLAKVALALVLAVGPVFILCAMFPATQRFTESWLGQAISFVLLNVLVGASITMLTSFASQFAQHIQANYGTTTIIKDTCSLLIVSCALGVVMLNLNTIASALSGGASISGVGRTVARYLMYSRAGGNKTPPIPGGGGGISPTAGVNSTASNSQSAGKSLYQRFVLDNIRRAS